VGLQAFLFNPIVLIDDKLKTIFAFGNASPVAKGDIVILPCRAFKGEPGFSDIDLIGREEAFLDAVLNSVGKSGASFL
jgi:hypothetical protein